MEARATALKALYELLGSFEINPKDPFAWLSKGNVLDKLEKYQEAIECYDKALEIVHNTDERWWGLWYNKGHSLKKLGENQKAIDCFDKALEINPRNTDTWYNKGIALNNLGKKQEAIICFQKFIDLATPQDAIRVEQSKQFVQICKG